MSEEAAKPEIPDKLYFRIGEVSKLVGVEPYVLRFWETEFPGLSPKKTDTGHRLFRRKDVELLVHIKHLLYEKRFTIEGARQWLKDAKAGRPPEPVGQQSLFVDEPMVQIRKELQAVLSLLSR